MGLSFDEKLTNYARLGLMYGLGFDQKPRPLYVDGMQEDDHGLLSVIAREAYKLGAPTVDVLTYSLALRREMFVGAPDDVKLYIPAWVSARAREIVDRDGARLALNGNAEFGVMDDVHPKYPSGYRAAQFQANEPLTTRRKKMLQPWSILDVPTTAWAHKLGMSISDLWEFLFEITGADRADSLAYALAMSETLHRRCALLNGLKISTLRFVGRGSDLAVGLSPRAQWIGGRKCAEDGTWFGPNWPSFEVFTTPDWRRTRGHVCMTLPSALDGGTTVENLMVDFSTHGRVSIFSADHGGEHFKTLITHDVGAAQLGEIALVGLDAPLGKHVKPHFCAMIDENKRCHLAFGSAYPAALEGGATASAEELATLGCNVSGVHQDMMISDATTSVLAFNDSGWKVATLMTEGRWVGEFA